MLGDSRGGYVVILAACWCSGAILVDLSGVILLAIQKGRWGQNGCPHEERERSISASGAAPCGCGYVVGHWLGRSPEKEGALLRPCCQAKEQEQQVAVECFSLDKSFRGVIDSVLFYKKPVLFGFRVVVVHTEHVKLSELVKLRRVHAAERLIGSLGVLVV